MFSSGSELPDGGTDDAAEPLQVPGERKLRLRPQTPHHVQWCSMLSLSHTHTHTHIHTISTTHMVEEGGGLKSWSGKFHRLKCSPGCVCVWCVCLSQAPSTPAVTTPSQPAPRSSSSSRSLVDSSCPNLLTRCWVTGERCTHTHTPKCSSCNNAYTHS